MNEANVTWEVESIDEENGEIIIFFTNGTRTNKIKYIWEGNLELLKEQINNDAVRMTHTWACSPIHPEIKSELLGLSGNVSITEADVFIQDQNFQILDVFQLEE